MRSNALIIAPIPCLACSSTIHHTKIATVTKDYKDGITPNPKKIGKTLNKLHLAFNYYV